MTERRSIARLGVAAARANVFIAAAVKACRRGIRLPTAHCVTERIAKYSTARGAVRRGQAGCGNNVEMLAADTRFFLFGVAAARADAFLNAFGRAGGSHLCVPFAHNVRYRARFLMTDIIQSRKLYPTLAVTRVGAVAACIAPPNPVDGPHFGNMDIFARIITEISAR